jgi:hypothetical protein
MIHIITSFYISNTNNHNDSDRNNEIFNALIKNIENTSVKTIHLFLDDENAYNKIQTLSDNIFFDKINICGIKPKAKHSDYFNYTVTNLKHEICMITNSDIYIHEINENLLLNIKNDKIAYALSRYEWDMTSPQINNYLGSHDAYIFNPSYINNSCELIDYHPNIPGIETHIIKFFIENNYKVYNPCYQIKIIHLHMSNVRNYYDNWIGLHKNGDINEFLNSIWCIPPIFI